MEKEVPGCTNQFLKLSQKFGGSLPKKFGGPKTSKFLEWLECPYGAQAYSRILFRNFATLYWPLVDIFPLQQDVKRKAALHVYFGPQVAECRNGVSIIWRAKRPSGWALIRILVIIIIIIIITTVTYETLLVSWQTSMQFCSWKKSFLRRAVPLFDCLAVDVKLASSSCSSDCHASISPAPLSSSSMLPIIQTLPWCDE